MRHLFRVLIPSWRFFDDVGTVPTLFYRVSNDGISFGPWTSCLKKIETRSWRELLVNTRQNYLFACHSLLNQLMNGIENDEDTAVSVELVKNLVRSEIGQPAPSHFQFKVMLGEEEILLSPSIGARV